MEVHIELFLVMLLFWQFHLSIDYNGLEQALFKWSLHFLFVFDQEISHTTCERMASFALAHYSANEKTQSNKEDRLTDPHEYQHKHE